MGVEQVAYRYPDWIAAHDTRSRRTVMPSTAVRSPHLADTVDRGVDSGLDLDARRPSTFMLRQLAQVYARQLVEGISAFMPDGAGIVDLDSSAFEEAVQLVAPAGRL